MVLAALGQREADLGDTRQPDDQRPAVRAQALRVGIWSGCFGVAFTALAVTLKLLLERPG